MKHRTGKFIGAVAFGLLLSTSSAFAEGSKEAPSDGWIEGSVETAIILNRHLNPFEIDTEVVDGVVILSGKVDEAIDRELAEQVSQSIEGVKSVTNKIEVVSDSANQERAANSSYQMFNDMTTTASIKSKLLWNEHTSGTAVDVDTKNGVVTLNGKVSTSAESALAEKIASNTQGVRDVENKIKVESKKKIEVGKIDSEEVKENARQAIKDVSQNVSDGWVTTKVKSTLTFSSNLSGSDVDVKTSNGVVTLTGQARSDAQKRLIEELVEDIRGVKQIENKLAVIKNQNSNS